MSTGWRPALHYRVLTGCGTYLVFSVGGQTASLPFSHLVQPSYKCMREPYRQQHQCIGTPTREPKHGQIIQYGEFIQFLSAHIAFSRKLLRVIELGEIGHDSACPSVELAAPVPGVQDFFACN